MTASHEVHIKNVGPILSLAIRLQPGVTVLRGRNGSGKSSALMAVEKLATGRGKLEGRRGAPGGGLVEGFGAQVRVGKRQTRTGEDELEVLALEADLDPASLVDPGIKDPEAADARRIRALLRLAKVQASLGDFAGLVGGPQTLARLVPDDPDTGDPLEIAHQVKRALEAAARRAEEERDRLAGSVAGLRDENSGLPLTAPSDEVHLAAAHDAALERLMAAEQRRKAGAEAAAREVQARATLNGLGPAPDIERLKAALASAESADEQAALAVDAARVALTKAESVLAEARSVRRQAEADLTAGEQMAATREAAQQAVSQAAGATFPSVEEVEALRAARDDARAAMLLGAEVRAGLAREDRISDMEQMLAAASAEAASRREQARRVDDVLSSFVTRAGMDGIRVEDGRLLVPDEQGGWKHFAELSHGEKWRVVMPACIAALGAGGLLVIPQEGWEAEDPVNRDYIANAARAAGVCVLTAEASDGELRAARVTGE